MKSAFVALLIVSVACAARPLVNEKVARRIDLTTNVVRITSEITLRNEGGSSESTFEVHLPAAQAEHLSDIEAEVSGKVQDVSVAKGSDSSAKFTVTLKPALPAGSTTAVTLRTAFTHSMTAFPTEITQMDNQLMVYNGLLHFYSSYPTESQTTDVQMSSSKIEDYTESDAFAVRGNTLSYGPYRDVAAFSTEPLRVHFENNYPFMTMTSLIKEVEVSHWGHLSVEEHVHILHTGAQLKGGFSRLDFQRNPAGTPSHFRALQARLPASAYQMYYRDLIGNVSTSRAHVNYPDSGEPFTKLEVHTRYLMLGGWKTYFYFGYAVPLGEMLGVGQDGSYTLEVPFGTAILGAVVDKLTTRIILPEGATDISVSGVTAEEERSHRKTYLDTAGRVVVSLNKANVVGENDRIIRVNYRFSSTSLYFDIGLVVSGFFLIFLFVAFTGRFTLSIGKRGKASAAFKEVAQELSVRLHLFDGELRSKLEDEDEGGLKAALKTLSSLRSEMVKHDSGLETKFGAIEQLATELAKLKREKTKSLLAEYTSKFSELDGDLTSKL